MSDSEKLIENCDSRGESNQQERKKIKKMNKKNKTRKISEDKAVDSKPNEPKSPSDMKPGSKKPQLQPGSHPFEVDDSDHCETPLRAYQDL
eukprot:CAMPEP_0116122756 /NCGR_PEP_ID=MMETSP0329-20121206/4382_1 /TAXON_ID=697910 /ORGANISM="Pseudo-nitzschia arenysensis, Strain B593" /LENGTH=90 /DNA_ID=CAMNT_0003616621 /DNA_START=45 /DNA_END=313 /DNA_ORIENTATION=-